MAASNWPRIDDAGVKPSSHSSLEEDGVCCDYRSSEIRHPNQSDYIDSGVSMSLLEDMNSLSCQLIQRNDLKAAVRDFPSGCVSLTCDSGLVSDFDSCQSTLSELQISADCSETCLPSKTSIEATNATTTHRREESGPHTAPSLELYQELFKQDEDGDTKLHLAIIQPDVAAAMWMIAACAPCRPTPLNIQNDKFRQTPLHLAVITNQPQIVRMLVICGALVDTRDHNGNTALHLACGRGLLECIIALTLPVTQQEHAELFYYCQTVRLPRFVPPPFHGPDLNCLDYEGYSYLHLVQKEMQTNRIEIINHLISCGANINVKDGKSGQSILHVAVKQRDTDFVHCLLHHPSLKINLKNYSQHTAFDVAHYLICNDIKDLLKRHGGVHSDMFLNGSDSCVDSSGDESDDMMDEYDDIVIGGSSLA